MIKHTCILLLLSLCLNANANDTGSLRPNDFAYGMPITTTDHTIYKALIPTAVYQGTTRADLGDMRVFNAAKQTVPMAIRPQSSSQHEWLELAGAADPKTADIWLFDTNGHMPIDTIRVKFPEKNTAVQVELFSRQLEEHDWRLRGQGLVYRLEENGRKRTSPDFKFFARPDRYWQLKAEDKENKPTLSFGWHPQELVFAAQGKGPYILAYGNQKVESANLEAKKIIAQLAKENNDKPEIATATLGEQKILGGAHLAEQGINLQWWIFWAGLILGTLLLLWLAALLYKQLRAKRK
jgi:hypothetical protein